jgi:hypothetical protein
MVSNRIGLAVVGGACVIAAGGGAFLATRYASGPPAPEAAVTAEVPSTAPQAVHETEAVLDAAPAPRGDASDAATAPAEEARATTAPPPVKSAPEAVAPPRVPRKAAERPAARRPRESVRGTETTRPAPVSPPEAATEPVERPAQTAAPSYVPAPLEPIELPRAAERQFDELVIPAESVIGLQLERTITSETARVEDRVEARVTRDVRVDGRVAVPAGSRVLGSVALVERGGKMKERARLGIRFHTLVLADGTSHALQTDTVYREGESPAGSSAAKIGGGAIGGAILGAIIGGGKGAVIGGATGAGGGTAAVMAGSRRPATMSAGSTMTVRVLSPVAVTVEH